MGFFLHPLSLSLTVGVLIFICSYRWSDQILTFFKEKTFGAKSEILETLEKLFIQNQKKVIRNCWILSGVFAGLIFFLLWPNILLAVIIPPLAIPLTWQGAKMLLRSMWKSHCDKVVDQMVEALVIMCNSLKVGLGLTQAMDRVIVGYPGPLAKEFRLILNKVQLGMAVEEALTEMGERVQRSDIDMMVSAINILKETGGNLAETFYVMSDTLRERQKMEKKIKALTAQGRMQAKILACVPFCLIGIFLIIDRDYIAPLIFKPLGWILLSIVCVLVGIGYLVMKKMVAIKV